MFHHVVKAGGKAADNALRRGLKQRALSSLSGPEESDVVIVGGGPAGLALATALGSSREVAESLRITLVEAGDLSKVKDWTTAEGNFSNRVSSITNASQAFLDNVGAWSHVELERTTSVEEMQVWDGISDARITFSASEMTTPGSVPASEMFQLVENLNLQRALLRHISSIPSVNIVDKVQVQTIQGEERADGGWPLVHLSDGRVLRARLLVGADGPNSPVRAYAGIQSYGWKYDTQAIVATMNHHPRTPFEPPNIVAYQRFLPSGPVAFLPLSSTASSLVWSTKPALAQALQASEPSILANMINAAFRLPEVSMRYLHSRLLDAHAAGGTLTPEELSSEISWREQSHSIDPHTAYSVSTLAKTTPGGVPPDGSNAVPPFVTSIQSGTIASFPLRMSHADAYIGEGGGARTVLVGDAAHTIHPLAGQGLNLGLGDAESLARCIHAAVILGGDIGSYTMLAPYARDRHFENHKMISAVDKLHKLYSATAEPIVWARSAGLEVLNELDTIKTAIVMSAGGAREADSVKWNVAASGIETLSKGMNSARSFAKTIAGLTGAATQGLLRNLSNISKP